MASGESSAFDAGEVPACLWVVLGPRHGLCTVVIVFICFLYLVVIVGSRIGSCVVVRITLVICVVVVAVITAVIVVVLNFLAPHVVELDEGPGGIILGFLIGASFEYIEPRFQRCFAHRSACDWANLISAPSACLWRMSVERIFSIQNADSLRSLPGRPKPCRNDNFWSQCDSGFACRRTR